MQVIVIQENQRIFTWTQKPLQMSVYNEMNVQSITYPLKPRLAL